MFHNILMNTDSYKASHYLQYPPNTTRVFSYIESRGGDYDYTTVLGFQAFAKEYLEGAQVTKEKIDEAEALWAAHGEPFNREMWEHILNKHGGRLPVEIKMVPEGTNVPTRNVLLTIENTDPACFWLTSFLETSLLRAIWYPTTVATISNSVRRMMMKYLEMTCETPEAVVPFMLHDFGARGVSSGESAALGGMAHLVNFMGTDTIAGILAARRYYGADMPGLSIPAAEHSTICAWGKKEEVNAYRNMLKQFAGKGKILAVVSDSYDIFHATSELWGYQLRQEVMSSGARVVVRPDSGDPVKVSVEVVKRLDKAFGSTVNDKGYKVLHNAVRVIQGDGVNPESIKDILDALVLSGYSVENMAFGMGGGLLQKLNRDTQRWAMKCSAVERDGRWVDVFKDPITDKGKISKKGRITLIQLEDGEYRTVRAPLNHGHPSVIEVLRPVFRDGELFG